MEDGEQESIRVAVKESAIDANEAVRDFVDRNGVDVQFPTMAAVMAKVQALSGAGEGPVRVQRAGPQEPRDIDAYVVSDPDRRTRRPDGSVDDELVFDTTATQFGALGETVITAHTHDPPALTYFIRHDLADVDIDPDALSVEVSPDPEPIDPTGVDGVWQPDCLATIYARPGDRLVTRYWCEIKTGRASLERKQEQVMRQHSTAEPVVLVRVTVTGLPQSYSVSFTRVRDAHPADRDDPLFGRDSRLDDFR